MTSSGFTPPTPPNAAGRTPVATPALAGLSLPLKPGIGAAAEARKAGFEELPWAEAWDDAPDAVGGLHDVEATGWWCCC